MFALIKWWEESDLTQKAFCEQTDIRYHVFHYWYRQYKDSQAINTSSTPAFVSLKVDPFSAVSAELVKILQLLQHDAHLNNKEIADKLGKSVTPVYERIKKLESSGIIEKYVALLNKNLIGKSLIAFINVQLKEHSQVVLKSFEKEVVKFIEVMECYQLTGASDFLVKVAITDMPEYNHFLMSKLATLPNIHTVQSFFILSEGKRETAYAHKLPPTKKPIKKNKELHR